MVSGITWIAEYFDPKLGGIIASIPFATVLSLLIVNEVLGKKGVIAFAEGIVIGNIPWYGYILAVILLTQRIGLVKSLAVGITIWLLLVPITWRLSQPV